jgi:hypothetical protein
MMESRRHRCGFAVKDPDLCRRLVTIFNDGDPKHARRLEEAIRQLEGIERLTHRPRVTSATVGRDLLGSLNVPAGAPTLFFIDPYGYKGLSLGLIGDALQNWGATASSSSTTTGSIQDCAILWSAITWMISLDLPVQMHCGRPFTACRLLRGRR